MDTESKLRDKLAGVIMRSLVLGNPKVSLVVTADDGSQPIVVAFDDELVSAVVERAGWSGGYANLFVVNIATHQMTPVAVIPPSAALDENSAEKLEANAIHADSTIGMLLENLALTPDGLTFQVRLPTSRSDVRQVGEPRLIPEMV